LSGFRTSRSHYKISTPGTQGADNATVRLDLDNEPQPDGLLFIDPDKGGQVVIDKDGYVVNGPELIAEISASSVSIDLNKELPVYRRNRVREYIVWRVYDEVIDWFYLEGDDYVPILADEAGVRKSRVFPGLWLDGPAMLRGDLAVVMAILQQGLASAEHVEFGDDSGRSDIIWVNGQDRMSLRPNDAVKPYPALPELVLPPTKK
jgi:hypothetical protein